MKNYLLLLFIFLFACEKVIEVDLPAPQKLIVIEGFLSDIEEIQSVRITQSNSFSDKTPVPLITNAQVMVLNEMGEIFSYNYHDSSGYYLSNSPFRGFENVSYRIKIILDDQTEISSDWDTMPKRNVIEELNIESFQENDVNNPNQQITVFYPKIIALDSLGSINYYRWKFFKNNTIFTEPESISIQNDRLFDGNFIPNNFQNFTYNINETMTVQLISISQNTYNYLSLLKSQLTTLGTSTITTPSIVRGNLFYTNDQNSLVLGFFGTTAISERTINIF